MKPSEIFRENAYRCGADLYAEIGSAELLKPKFEIILNSPPLYEQYYGVSRSMSLQVKIYPPPHQTVAPDFTTYIFCGLTIDGDGNMTGISPENGLVHYSVPFNMNKKNACYVLHYKPETGSGISRLISVSLSGQETGGSKLFNSVDTKSHLSQLILDERNLPREVDEISTVSMYLTGKTPDGTSLTPDAILRQPLIPSR